MNSPRSPEFIRMVLDRLAKGESQGSICRELGCGQQSVKRWRSNPERYISTERVAPISCSPLTSPRIEVKSEPVEQSKELIFDLESLPNEGYFFECYNDKRSIPLDFIRRPKAIATIAYKWRGEEETHVLVAKEPYEDKDVLAPFMEVWRQAKYVVAHYGDGFDIPFISARLMVNGMPPIPPVASVDTYKLAKKNFGRSLNSNKLDYLGEILGLGRKNKTDAKLWVKCAQGDAEAFREMAMYNVQDVVLLEAVYDKLRPYGRSKVNMNIGADSPVKLCKSCGSSDLDHTGYEMTASTMRDRCLCNKCGSWSTFPMRKQ